MLTVSSTEKPIGFSIHNVDYRNKYTPEQATSLAHNWTWNSWAGPSHMIDAVRKGRAVAVGRFKQGNKVAASFEGGQYIMFDFDDAMVLSWDDVKDHPWFKEHCLFAYTTASFKERGSFRVVGCFERPITNIERYNAAVAYLFDMFPGVDTSMKGTQCAYGSEDCQVIEWNLNNRVPVNYKETVARDPFLQMIKSLDTDGDGDSLEHRKAKALLCLKFLPVREKGNNTYNICFETLCGLVHEFGVDEALTIIDEANWHSSDWDVFRKACDIEETGKNSTRKLGSVILGTRNYIAADPERLEEFNIRLEEINKQFRPKRGEFVNPVDQATASERIAELMDQLIELELDITRDTWAEKQVLIKEACSLGPSKAEVQKRLFEHVCTYLGVDLGATKGNGIKTKNMNRLRKLAFSGGDTWLVPGYLQQKRDAVLFGDSGSGKTAIALDLIRCMIQGQTFADSDSPIESKGKVLFIASDGGPVAESVLAEYLFKMGVCSDNRWDDRFEYWAADSDSSEPAWNLTTGNLIKLRERVASGEFDLVVIDSLKAVCAGSNYSIDDRTIGQAMRLVQAIVTPHSSLLWIHHTNKSNSSSSHSAGGSTDVIEVVSAAVQVKKVWNDAQTQQKSTMVLHKLRGEGTRSFEFDFSFGLGVVPEVAEMSSVREIVERKSDLPNAILVAIRDAEFGRMGREALSDMLGRSANTIDNYTNELKKKNLIQKHGTGYQLTKEGKAVATMLNRKVLESVINSGTDF